MKKIILKNQHNSLEVSKLSIGQTGTQINISNPENFDLIKNLSDLYFEAGGNCIDTARLYENGLAEAKVSEYLKTRVRENVILSTKCSHYRLGVPNAPMRLSENDILSDVHESLKQLQTDYIDILFLHRDDIKKPVSEIMPVLDGLVKSGKVRILGASNWTGGRIAEANKFAKENNLTPFSVSQIQWSLALTSAAQTGDLSHIVMDNTEYLWYKQESFPVMSWSPSARGFFSKYASGAALSPSLIYKYGWLNENYNRAKRVRELANELNAPIGAIVLAYLMCNEVSCVPVASFSSETQLKEAIFATKLTLTQEQINFLENK